MALSRRSCAGEGGWAGLGDKCGCGGKSGERERALCGWGVSPSGRGTPKRNRVSVVVNRIASKTVSKDPRGAWEKRARARKRAGRI